MGVVYLLSLEPLDEEGKVIIDLLPVKNTVDHVAAEKTHFDLVASVGVDFCVFMDWFEDVGSGWTIRKFELVKWFFVDC